MTCIMIREHLSTVKEFLEKNDILFSEYTIDDEIEIRVDTDLISDSELTKLSDSIGEKNNKIRTYDYIIFWR